METSNRYETPEVAYLQLFSEGTVLTGSAEKLNNELVDF